ncbi:kinesin-like protein KIF23 isoform X2 [Pseudomyrmex gracilis]|uniref:kinesin-like protein KIF23 isoform X2 n=1 Tax=Pseudomyrmex gracilis TaxID=219809 RepID=UPI000994CA67|nr:kinesin-like protein KIF23 isoform X2 [Pseudomyrmex gracilis]
MATLNEPYLPDITQVTDSEDELEMLMRCLENRVHTRDLLRKDIEDKENNFRNILVEMIRENESLKHCNDEQKKTISVLEGRVCKLQNNIDCLLYKLNSACDAVRNMQEELKIRDRQLKQHATEKDKIMQRYRDKIQEETDKVAKEFENKLRVQREQLESCIEKKDNKLQLVKQILTPTADNKSAASAAASRKKHAKTIKKLAKFVENSSVTSVDPQTTERHTSNMNARSDSDDKETKIAREETIPSTSKEKLSTETLSSKTDIAEDSRPIAVTDSQSPSKLCSDDVATNARIKSDTKHMIEKIAIANPRYRSHCAEKWIDHRPPGTIPIGTIMQPQTQHHQRTVRKLTSPKPFTNKSARYCLLAQEQDTDGELETKLYKANVLPTCGGGAQVVFNDIERLQQISLVAAKQKAENKNSK